MGTQLGGSTEVVQHKLFVSVCCSGQACRPAAVYTICKAVGMQMISPAHDID